MSYLYVNSNSSNIWIVSPRLHTVKYISNKTGAIYKVMGKENFAGYRDGYITNALFNKPSSISIFISNSTTSARLEYTRPIFVNTTKANCTQITKENYTDCVNESVTDTTPVDPLNVVFLDFTPEEVLKNLTKNETIGHKMLYIADKDNHCIRSVDLDECKIILAI